MSEKESIDVEGNRNGEVNGWKNFKMPGRSEYVGKDKTTIEKTTQEENVQEESTQEVAPEPKNDWETLKMPGVNEDELGKITDDASFAGSRLNIKNAPRFEGDDDILRIFNKRDAEREEAAKRQEEQARKDADEKYSQAMLEGVAKNYEEAQKREAAARAASENEKRMLKSKPSFKKRLLRTVAGTLAITAIAGVSAKKLADAHTKQGEKDKTEAYDKGYDAGYEKGHEIGLEDGKKIVFESMKDSAENQTTEGAITDTQHRANVNERLQQIKQEIADRYDDIDVNDITISTERDSNGKLQIEITNKEGKQIPVDQEKENEIKTFIEDYQNPMLDGTTTEQQKETLQKELEEKNNEEVQNTITVLPEKEDDTER